MSQDVSCPGITSLYLLRAVLAVSVFASASRALFRACSTFVWAMSSSRSSFTSVVITCAAGGVGTVHYPPHPTSRLNRQIHSLTVSAKEKVLHAQ